MENRRIISKYINSGIAILITGVAIVGLPIVFTDFPSFDALIALLSLTALFGLATAADTLTKHTNWTGFARSALLVAWIIFGVSEAALVAIFGAGIALLSNRFMNHETKVWTVTRDYLANCAAALLVTHTLYTALDGQLPRIIVQEPFFELPILILSLLSGLVVSALLIAITYKVGLSTFIRRAHIYAFQEILVILVALALPIIYTQLNVLIFLVIIALIAVQIIRQARIIQTDRELNERIREISILNSLSTSISTQLSLIGTLETVYRELNEIIDASTIYIGIYDVEQQTLEYPLVMVDGKLVAWAKQSVQSRVLQAYVIQKREALLYTREDIKNKLKNLVDYSSLSDVQYMIAPLQTSDKIVGILGAHHKSDTRAFSDNQFALFKTIAHQASLAIRNATLYDRTVRLADNLAIINQSLQSFMFDFNQADALRTTCEIAINLSHADKAAIYLLTDHDPNRLYRVAALGFDGLEFAETLPYESYRVNNSIQIVNDIAQTDAKALNTLAEMGQFKACVHVALRSGAAVMGVLGVYHNQPHHYNAPELNLLEMLANQITAALDNADLLEALELYAAEQAQLVHLSRISSGTLDLEQIIKSVCELMVPMIGVSRAAIGLFLSERQILQFQSPDAAGDSLFIDEITVSDIPEFETIINSESAPTIVIYQYDDITVSSALRKYMARNDDLTLALVPMSINQDVVGSMLLGSDEKRHFTDNDLRLIEMANNQVSSQIYNARTHEHTQAQLANRLEQLELIEAIAQQISQAFNLDSLIENVLVAALQSTQADFVSIALRDKNHEFYYDIISREVIAGKLVPYQVHIHLTGGVINHVIASGELVILPDNTKSDYYIQPTDSDGQFDSSLAVPLITGDSTIGMLNLESKHKNFFTLEQASFIKSLAGHAAISINNANLLKERERRINTLTLLRKLSLQAISVINPSEIMDVILWTAQIMLNGSQAMIYEYHRQNDTVDLIQSTHPIQTEQSTTLNDLILSAVHDAEIKIIQDSEFDDIVPYETFVIMPITRRLHINEVLCVGFDAERYFNDDDLYTLDLLAAQVAGHLENAALNEIIMTSNDRMRAILDSTNDGIILLDNEGRIQDANQSVETLTGVDLQTHLQKSIKTIAHLDTLNEKSSEIWSELIKAYDDLARDNNEKVLNFGDGDAFLQLRLLLTHVLDVANNVAGQLLILRDTTEEQRLQSFRDKMQSMVLHDLRGPLTAIVTSMYVAENMLELHDGSDIDPFFNETLTTTLNSAEEMLRMIDTLRDLPMLNKIHIQQEQEKLSAIVEQAYQLLLSNFKEANIEVEITVPEDIRVFVDTSLVQRVFVNLLHNAFKFTPENGKILIRADCDAADGFVRVQVADTGPGIPIAERERIFKQYIQIEDYKPRTGGKGMGLGLNFCMLAVEAHGGRIWVEAESPLSGACFAFTVPHSQITTTPSPT